MLNLLCFFLLFCFLKFFVNVLLCTLDLLAVNGSNITFSLSLVLVRTSAIFYFLYKFSFHLMFLPLIEKEICHFLLSAVQCFILFSLKKKKINVLQKCFNLLLKRKRDFCIVNNCVIST